MRQRTPMGFHAEMLREGVRGGCICCRNLAKTGIARVIVFQLGFPGDDLVNLLFVLVTTNHTIRKPHPHFRTLGTSFESCYLTSPSSLALLLSWALDIGHTLTSRSDAGFSRVLPCRRVRACLRARFQDSRAGAPSAVRRAAGWPECLHVQAPETAEPARRPNCRRLRPGFRARVAQRFSRLRPGARRQTATA